MKNLLLVIIMLSSSVICFSQKDEYKIAKKQNTIESYKEFIKAYPSSDYTESAMKKLIKLEYRRAIDFNTIASLDYFQETYSNSTYTKDIQSRIYDLEYTKSIEANSISEYENFLSKYPKGKYAEEINQKLQLALEDKERFNDIYNKPIDGNYDSVLFVLNYINNNHESEDVLKVYEWIKDSLNSFMTVTYQSISICFLNINIAKIAGSEISEGKKFYYDLVKVNDNLKQIVSFIKHINTHNNEESIKGELKNIKATLVYKHNLSLSAIRMTLAMPVYSQEDDISKEYDTIMKIALSKLNETGNMINSIEISP